MSDLLRQLLTLEVGSLVLSVTFADKVLAVFKPGFSRKIVVVSIWGLLLVAIIQGWYSLQYLFIAASNMRLERDFSTQMNHAVIDFGRSAILFVVALTALVVSAAISLFLLHKEQEHS